MAAAASSARAVLLLLRPRHRHQQLLPLRLATAPAWPAAMRHYVLLLQQQQQPHRCWAARAAPSRISSGCDGHRPHPQAPGIGPDSDAPASCEEGEAAVVHGGEQAPQEALRAAPRRSKGKGGRGGPTPAPPVGGPKQGRGGGGGSIHAAPPSSSSPAAKEAPRAAAAAAGKRRSSSSGPTPRGRPESTRQGDRAAPAKPRGKGGRGGPAPPGGGPIEGRGGDGGIHH